MKRKGLGKHSAYAVVKVNWVKAVSKLASHHERVEQAIEKIVALEMYSGNS